MADDSAPKFLFGSSNQDAPVTMIAADQLSEAERAILEREFGYDGKSEVPSDLSHRLPPRKEKTITTDDVQKLVQASQSPPDYSEVKGLDLSGVQTQQIDAIPDDLQKLWDKVMVEPEKPAEEVAAVDGQKQAFQQALQVAKHEAKKQAEHTKAVQNLNPDIAAAFSNLNAGNVEVVNLDPEPSSSESETASSETKTSSTKKTPEQLRKERYDNLVETIDAEDQKRFRNAICTMQPFQKEYTLLGGSLRLIFNDLTEGLEEMYAKQIASDRMHKRLPDTQLLRRQEQLYSLACLLSEITVGGKTLFKIPAAETSQEFIVRVADSRGQLDDHEASDTPLRTWARVLQENLLQGTTRRVIFAKLVDFQTLLAGLYALSEYDEFFA